jgi:hypothetical protein
MLADDNEGASWNPPADQTRDARQSFVFSAEGSDNVDRVVSHQQNHRGAHPEDARLFGDPELPKLRAAAEEMAWLRERGYPLDTVVELVGGHHQLESRQRLAVRRAVCSPAQYMRRIARELEPEEAARRPLLIDGFNLIITIEVALSHGLLLRCADGAIRDIAGLRGSYHPVEETEGALTRIGAALKALRPSKVKFLLDEPVSNSGRLKERILDHAKKWKAPVSVELVPDPDAILKKSANVVTSDSEILDHCASWLNLGKFVVGDIPDIWMIELQP